MGELRGDRQTARALGAAEHGADWLTAGCQLPKRGAQHTPMALWRLFSQDSKIISMHEHGPTKPVEGRLGDVDSLFAARMSVDHALQNPAPKERPSPEKQLHGVAGVPVAVEFVGQEQRHQPQRQRAPMGLGPALSQHAAQQGRRGDPDEQGERRELVGAQL